MDSEQLTEKLTQWIQDRVKVAGSKGVVLGISGGIDSAVVAALCQRAFPQDMLGINMPCYSDPRDREHAKLVAEKFSIPFKVLDLNDVYDGFMKILTDGSVESDMERLAKSNLKVRLRMASLYYHANRLNYMVVGASNRSELSTGYFTKWGDGGVDIMPIGNLVKKQVIELARYLGIPEEIIKKPPSAGLWQGQTDEGEMGLTYQDLDNYLTIGRATAEIKNKIETMMAKAQHKRIMPPIPDF